MIPERFPRWLRKRFITDSKVNEIRSLLKDSGLNTVCQSAGCPNMGECFRKGRATFLILGNTCTRRCGFCGVKKGSPERIDENEPRSIARTADEMGLDHVIITSVTRDDLADGGAGQFAACVEEIKRRKGVKVEVLTPDFNGDTKALKTVLAESPDVFAHNIETVPRLYNRLRPGADYQRSLNTLKEARKLDPGITVKSGMMVGLGEGEEEVLRVMADLKKSACSIITIGQYLRPSKEQVEVFEFINPLIFERYKNRAREMGFRKASCGPFVRSSYMEA